MKTIGCAFLWLLCFPFNATVAWPALLLFRLLGWVRDIGTERGALVATFTPKWTGQLDVNGRPRRWPYSTTLGHAIAYQERHRAPKGQPMTLYQQHEHIHREQGEDMALRMFIVGLVVFLVTGNLPLGLVIWFLSYAWLATNFLAAILRGRHPYREASHEEHAYGSDDERVTKSPTE